MSRLWFLFRCWWHGYNSDFVDSILAQDRMENDGGFTNIEDLLKYLDEE